MAAENEKPPSYSETGLDLDLTQEKGDGNNSSEQKDTEDGFPNPQVTCLCGQGFAIPFCFGQRGQAHGRALTFNQLISPPTTFLVPSSDKKYTEVDQWAQYARSVNHIFAPEPTNPMLDDWSDHQYGIQSLHYPSAYHSTMLRSKTPWTVSFTLWVDDIKSELPQSFRWRQNIDACYQDTIERISGLQTFRRQISWCFRRALPVLRYNWAIDIQVHCDDPSFLAGLSRTKLADMISLNTAVRITGSSEPSDIKQRPLQGRKVFYLDFLTPYQGVNGLPQIDHDAAPGDPSATDWLELDEPDLRSLVKEHFPKVIHHPSKEAYFLGLKRFWPF